jgi:hypothetical protein
VSFFIEHGIELPPYVVPGHFESEPAHPLEPEHRRRGRVATAVQLDPVLEPQVFEERDRPGGVVKQDPQRCGYAYGLVGVPLSNSSQERLTKPTLRLSWSLSRCLEVAMSVNQVYRPETFI